MATGTASDPIDEGYVLQRNDEEVRRLDNQNNILFRMFGYHIHPAISKKLGPNAVIADVAAGTGIWLQTIAQDYPATAQFHAFDISAEQFPKASQLPPNISIHIHDARTTFPAEWHGKFDLVQIRFVVCGMRDNDWEIMLRNVQDIVKPGGAVQWLEPEFTGPLTTPAAKDGTEPVAIKKLWSIICDTSGVSKLKYKGTRKLPQIFPQAGLQDVDSVIITDLETQLMGEWSRNLIQVGFQLLQGLEKKRAPGVGSNEEINKLHMDALEEYRKGCRPFMEVCFVIGFKPL